MSENRFVLKARIEGLPQVMDFAERMMEQAGCPLKILMQVNLAIEEIFVNIASYAYEGGEGNAEIIAEKTENPRGISFTFIDQGIPYNPLLKEDPDITLSAEDRNIGGLGVYLVKQYMDEEIYEYKDGSNILTVKKFF